LFGSRARGDYREDSDWDTLIVTKKKLDNRLEDVFWMEVERRLVYLDIVLEILIVSRDEFEKYKRPAYVYYYAERDGIVIR